MRRLQLKRRDLRDWSFNELLKACLEIAHKEGALLDIEWSGGPRDYGVVSYENEHRLHAWTDAKLGRARVRELYAEGQRRNQIRAGLLTDGKVVAPADDDDADDDDERIDNRDSED